MTIAPTEPLAAQVIDDLDLLDLMVADQHAGDARFQPTNYWALYIPAVIQELRRGLHDFQSRVKSPLGSFGASEQSPLMLNGVSGVPPQAVATVTHLIDGLNEAILANKPTLSFGLTVEDILRTGYLICEHQAAASPQIEPISKLSVSRAGDPFGFEVGKRFLTRSTLSYYMRYAYVVKHVDLREIDTVVELGSGAGKQAEILKRLHPHLTIVLLDLAPPLYVAERYLHAALPDDVVGYRDTRGPGTPGLEAAKIHFLSNTRIGDLDGLGRTLFWNAASFAEMEPDVVYQYGADVSRFADALFLHQCFEGKERGHVGAGGVLQPVRLPHYHQAFSGYKLRDRAPAHTGLSLLVEGECRYDDTFWTRAGD